MAPSPPSVVFSQTFWTSEICFPGPRWQPISFDLAIPDFLCLLLLPHLSLSGFLLGSLVTWKCDCGSLALRLWLFCIRVLGSFLELHSVSSSWVCVHVLTGPYSYCLLPASVMVCSSLMLSHGLVPTSLHNGPWFLLRFWAGNLKKS